MSNNTNANAEVVNEAAAKFSATLESLKAAMAAAGRTPEEIDEKIKKLAEEFEAAAARAAEGVKKTAEAATEAAAPATATAKQPISGWKVAAGVVGAAALVGGVYVAVKYLSNSGAYALDASDAIDAAASALELTNG